MLIFCLRLKTLAKIDSQENTTIKQSTGGDWLKIVKYIFDNKSTTEEMDSQPMQNNPTVFPFSTSHQGKYCSEKGAI